MRKTTIALMCLFVALVTGFAQEKTSDGLLNITYLNDPLPKKWLERLEPLLDYELSFYKELGLEKEFSVKVHAFKDRAHGYSYMESEYGRSQWKSESGVKTGGVFFPSLNVIGIFGFGKDMEYTIGLIGHEVSHSFFSQVYPRGKKAVPIWLNEGLAEYFRNCTVKRGGEVRHELGVDVKGPMKTRYMLGEMDVDAFLDYDRNRFMQMEYTDDRSAYRIAYAIVSFMLSDAVPQGYFRQFFSVIKNPEVKLPSSRVVDVTYPGGIKAFEKDFRSYILK